jgi:DNA-binding HxlR family transcriptional regulator
MFDWLNAKRAINLIKHEWDPVILALLQDRGPLRHKDLRQTVGTADRVLSNTLKRLVHHGLVTRHLVDTAYPARVVYQLTPAAEDLLNCLSPLVEWSKRHQPDRPNPP